MQKGSEWKARVKLGTHGSDVLVLVGQRRLPNVGDTITLRHRAHGSKPFPARAWKISDDGLLFCDLK